MKGSCVWKVESSDWGYSINIGFSPHRLFGAKADIVRSDNMAVGYGGVE